MTKRNTTTYTVRPPGCAAWAGPGLTLRQALRDYHEARRNGLHVLLVRDDTGESVDVHALRERLQLRRR